MGEPGCTPVGAPCPVGDFPEGLPGDQPRLYVLAGATAGGDGRPTAAPFVAAPYACRTHERMGPFCGDSASSAVAESTVELTRVLLARNRAVGVFVADVGTAATLTGLAVRDTQSRESDGQIGRGLNVQEGATAEVTRGLFERNHQFGAIAIDEGTVTLTDTVVEDTREQPCAATTCPEQAYGVGLASTASGTMEATRFAITRSALCCVFLVDNGEIDLSMGQVSDSPVGVCLQVDGYPVTRLTEGVRYVRNGINLEATSLPLPEVSGPSTPRLEEDRPTSIPALPPASATQHRLRCLSTSTPCAWWEKRYRA